MKDPPFFVRSHGSFSQDGNGEGGYLRVYRNPTQTGFYVDGNYNARGAPLVKIQGGVKSATFDMRTAVTDNGSVILPANAIDDNEIENEPGIAANHNSSQVTLTQDNPVFEDVVAVTITIPTSGYIVVQARAMVLATNTYGTNQLK